MTVKVSLDMRKLQRLQKDIEPRAEALIDKVAFDVEADAKKWAEALAFDTGAMTNSIYTVTTRSNGQSEAQRKATQSAARDGKVPAFEDIPIPTQKLLARVGPSVHYAPHVHWGTVKMRYSRPFLLMAMDENRPSWAAAWKALFKGY